MHQFCELHDSTLQSISFEGDSVLLEMPHAYIHQFENEPFKEPGAGYSQRGLLKFTGVTASTIPPLPFQDAEESWDIWTGSITIDNKELDNVFELPLNVQGATVQAEIRLICGGVIKITGTGVAFIGIGDPTYLEKYRA